MLPGKRKRKEEPSETSKTSETSETSETSKTSETSEPNANDTSMTCRCRHRYDCPEPNVHDPSYEEYVASRARIRVEGLYREACPEPKTEADHFYIIDEEITCFTCDKEVTGFIACRCLKSPKNPFPSRHIYRCLDCYHQCTICQTYVCQYSKYLASQICDGCLRNYCHSCRYKYKLVGECKDCRTPSPKCNVCDGANVFGCCIECELPVCRGCGGWCPEGCGVHCFECSHRCWGC